MNLRVVVCSAALFASACSGSKAAATISGYPDAPLTTSDQAKRWASISAPNAYVQGVAPTFALGGTVTTDDGGSMPLGDPNCPKITKTDTTEHVEGGCTDSDGRAWVGTLDSQRDKPDGGTGHYTYSGFGNTSQSNCGGSMVDVKVLYDGTFSVSGDDTAQQFTVDLTTTTSSTSSSCTGGSSAISYTGTLTGNSTWKGSGDMGDSVNGKVHGETVDEVTDGPCSSEAQSGTTTITSGSSKVVITYDGATKCDTGSTVKWSLNGVDQGELTGVRCSSGAGLFALAAVLTLRRRRR